MYAEEIVARESIIGGEILVLGWAGRASIAVRKYYAEPRADRETNIVC